MKLYIMLIILLQFTAGDGSGAERDGGTTGQQGSKVHHFSGEGVRGKTLISAAISPAEVGQGRKSREETTRGQRLLVSATGLMGRGCSSQVLWEGMKERPGERWAAFPVSTTKPSA